MEFACPYCRGSGKFRHERPEGLSDGFWINMTGGAMRCALCKGDGKLYRPIESPILDTGLIFVRTGDRVLVGCPEALCQKWVDCTAFFQKREKFEGTCPVGHAVTIEIQPSWGKRS